MTTLTPTDTTTLFCIPHAGGSATYYSQFAAFLPAHIQLQALELPGRGRRCREALHSSLETLSNDLFKSILPVAEATPYALFGHSMGGLLAFLCAMLAQDRNVPLPRALFISAAATPGNPVLIPDIPPIALAPDELWRHIVKLGGIPQCVASSEEFSSYFTPILHADFTAAGTWPPQKPITSLPIPIIVLLGEDDFLTEEKAMEWKKLTTQDFALHLFRGNHFYLQDNWAEIAEHISQTLSRTS